MRLSFFDRRVLSHFDFLLILLLLPIVGLSFFLVSEISTMLALKQLAYVTVAIVCFIVVFFFPLRKYIWLIPFFYWINILLLIAVKLFGVTKLGAKRWLEIPFLELTIQPSELMKPAFILMLGYIIARRPPSKDGYEWIEFFKISFYILLPFFLIASEPDLGTATIILLVGGGVLLSVGIKRKIWVTLLSLFLLSSTIIYDNLHDYQKKRISDFLAEKPSYHVQQSIIAIGSGGFIGKDKEDSTQTQLKFLPISSSDFIFAYLVERFGFFGALIVILLYASLILNLLSLTQKVKKDYQVSVVIVAVAILLFLYMSINISMTIGLAPVVGVPLPLFSHGGSSFITFIVLFAIIENLLVSRFKHIYDFDIKI